LQGKLVAVLRAGGLKAIREGGLQRAGQGIRAGRAKVGLFRNHRCASGVEPAPEDLSRSHAWCFVELPLQSQSGLVLGTIGVGALALALAKLIFVASQAGSVAARGAIVAELIDFAAARHHDGNRRKQLERTAQLLCSPQRKLRRPRINVAIESAEERGFEDVWQGGGSEERPILPAFEVDIRVFAGGVIHTHERQAHLQAGVANGRDVAVIHGAEHTFVVGFDAPGEGQLR